MSYRGSLLAGEGKVTHPATNRSPGYGELSKGQKIMKAISRNLNEGSVIQGIGGALFESIDFADGKILNPRFSRYRVPRFSDMPKLETVLLDRKDLPSVGAGECPIVALAPAVSAAIFEATGLRPRSLPMAPETLRADKKIGQKIRRKSVFVPRISFLSCGFGLYTRVNSDEAHVGFAIQSVHLPGGATVIRGV